MTKSFEAAVRLLFRRLLSLRRQDLTRALLADLERLPDPVLRGYAYAVLAARFGRKDLANRARAAFERRGSSQLRKRVLQSLAGSHEAAAITLARKILRPVPVPTARRARTRLGPYFIFDTRDKLKAPARVPRRGFGHAYAGSRLRRWLGVDGGSAVLERALSTTPREEWKLSGSKEGLFSSLSERRKSTEVWGSRTETLATSLVKPRPRRKRSRTVNTGFSSSAVPARPVRSLRRATSYYFWLDIGKAAAGSIESRRVGLQKFVGPGEVLDVVLFTERGGLRLRGPARGALLVGANARVTVWKRAAAPRNAGSRLGTRLFFHVATPKEAGRYRLRCSIYCRGVLLQSRRIDVPIGVSGKSPRAVVDYLQARRFDRHNLRALSPIALSLMLNKGSDGTHQLRCYSGDAAPVSIQFHSVELQNFIDRSRKALRMVSWGSEELWRDSKQDPYRYSSRGSPEKLKKDLLLLARRGHANWDTLVEVFRGEEERARFRERTRRPQAIELALKRSSNLLVPLATLYDHKFDVGVTDDASFTLCETFLRSLAAEALDMEPCFQGHCPNRNAPLVVCPGGFWGFRHALGLPLSREALSDHVMRFITEEDPIASVGVSTDPMLKRRPKHVENLQKLFPDPRWTLAETRADLIKTLQQGTSAFVYLYCHGGRSADGEPYLRVGPSTDPEFRRATIGDAEIAWTKPRPLVFINGCHTTALEPESAIDLVSGFVGTARAAGVIGTEVTVFESMAVAFAERFARLFVNEDKTAGEAVRLARLHILKSALNPLGLVYLPYVLPIVTLREVTAP